VEPYYADSSVTLYYGDALAVLRKMPDASVDCCVTSPPYYGLRDYGVDGQYGLEASPAEYVEKLRVLFAEVRRVLADDGTCWLNLGDSYSVRWSSQRADGNRGTRGRNEDRQRWSSNGAVPAKNLLGIPWRTAFALQDDGWILRNDIIWAKANSMPESVSDRFSSRHEYLFLLSKSRRYWFDLEAVREPLARSSVARLAQDVESQRGSARAHGGTKVMKAVSRRDSFARGTKEAEVPGQSTAQHRLDRPNVVAGTPLGRNPGDVWALATQPFSAAHFAVMPVALAGRCVQAGCKPRGVVLDPFSGSGTTGLAATKHGRRYIGVDLNQDYLDLSLRTRLAQSTLDLGEPA
jgi:site-specific DNA-methyltransferase (cytosine-N4-specific)